jgi:hypothetical protein
VLLFFSLLCFACRLHTSVRPGDTVNVIGEFGSDGTCVLDHNQNLLVVHPDLLISGSRVLLLTVPHLVFCCLNCNF